MKQFDSIMGSIKDIAALTGSTVFGALGIVFSGPFGLIPILGSAIIFVTSSFFLLFKVAAINSGMIGVYSRMRALACGTILVISWTMSSLLLIILYMAFAETLELIHLFGMIGLFSGIITGLFAGSINGTRIRSIFFSVIELDAIDTFENYPWMLPSPSTYLLSGLVSLAASILLFAAVPLVSVELQVNFLLRGTAALISLLFLMLMQTYLEPIEYTRGLGDFLFGLASFGAITSITIDWYFSLLTIFATTMFLFIRKGKNIDTLKIGTDFEEDLKISNLLDEQFNIDHSTYITLATFLKIAFSTACILSVANYILSANPFLFRISVIELVVFMTLDELIIYLYKRKKRKEMGNQA